MTEQPEKSNVQEVGLALDVPSAMVLKVRGNGPEVIAQLHEDKAFGWSVFTIADDALAPDGLLYVRVDAVRAILEER